MPLSNDPTIRTSKRGSAVIQDPYLNRGSAFTNSERDALGLHGLLPPHVSTQQEQKRRAMRSIHAMTEPLDKYVACAALQNRNEHLFYAVLMENMEELMPIVYTPTVGLATQQYSQVFQGARGLWLNPDMRGAMAEIMANAVHDRDIRLIVATDNESILGIGDQGAGGMAISVGKLSLYVAGAGLNPAQTLPVSLDVGTNNEALLADDLYLGWRQPRLEGQAYRDFVAEFVDAVRQTCPNALLQWEDFRKDNALSILNNYRDEILSFNDDIQGTGAVCLAGLFSALRISGEHLADQRILILGAGAAGMGITAQIRSAIHAQGGDPAPCIAVLDSRGLLVDDQAYSDAYKADLAWPRAQAQRFGLADPARRTLTDVVHGYRPTVLIGTSGQPGVFAEELVRSMLGYCKRPIVMPFSNPTDRSEAIPEDILRWTDGKALVATGSPFAPVTLNGTTHHIGQGNNVFIFPGLGLGALLAKSTTVSDAMVTAAAEACANAITQAELEQGRLYPNVNRLRDVSSQVAIAVAKAAIDEGTSNVSETQVTERISRDLWQPSYPPIEAR